MSQIVTNGVVTDALSQAEFQEKMQARMRTMMGEMLPDATLAEIVKRGIENAFFKPQEESVKTGNGYYDRQDIKVTPPWTQQFLQEECKAQVKVAVQQWIKDNSGMIKDMLEKTLREGVANTTLSTLNELWKPALQSMQSQMYDILNKMTADANR